MLELHRCVLCQFELLEIRMEYTEENLVDIVENKAKDVATHFDSYVRGFNIGRASVEVLAPVSVSVYGTTMKLRDVGKINVVNAQSVFIYPYDQNSKPAIISALLGADLGVGAVSEEDGVRVSFPALSFDRRKSMVGVIKKHLEESKIRIRNVRREANVFLDKQQQEKTLSKDECQRLKTKVQNVIDKMIAELDSLFDKKQAEILKES